MLIHLFQRTDTLRFTQFRVKYFNTYTLKKYINSKMTETR